MLTNSQKLVHFFDIQWPWSTAIYSLIVVVWVSLVIYAWRVTRAPRFAPEAGPVPAGEPESEAVTR